MSHLTLNQRYQIWAFRHLKPAQIARSGRALPDYNAQQAHKTYLAGRAKNATKATAAIHQAIA